ncbi:MAG: outer membrane lipid asymmetry maintenance protein MlaD [Acetobacter sp.]|nr:outer membrane lipid asymmetry maintenance protein MlaD [Acetobacter sp.]
MTREIVAKAQGSIVEFLVGLAVLVLFIAMLWAAVLEKKSVTPMAGYTLNADFSHIDGLDVGADVRLAGVRVGTVVAETVDPENYQAHVTFTVRSDIKLSRDTAAIITSDSLLGGKYIDLSPGGSDVVLRPGATLTQTQGAISLEQLLSRFVLSVTKTSTQGCSSLKTISPNRLVHSGGGMQERDD